MDLGIAKVVNEGNGNAILYTALLGAMIANAVPTPFVATDNITISCGYLSMVVSHLKRITFSWAIMWTEGSSHWRRFACFLHIRYASSSLSRCKLSRSNIPRISSYCEEIMNVRV
jgi:hypothetical protein